MYGTHPTHYVAQCAGSTAQYGSTPGTCRITGRTGVGLPFRKWVRDTFNDHAALKPGDIISNESLFCFDESSVLLQNKVGKDKPQRFRTYSHIVRDGQWFALTKGDKKTMYDLIASGAELVCISESGQKHLLFKHREGFWQFEESHILPDIPLFTTLHSTMCDLMRLGFSQAEVISGTYNQKRVIDAGFEAWQTLESILKPHRGSKMIAFCGFMLFLSEEEKEVLKQKFKK